jgi:DNA invertase Pin-like site-specific DNA recombinase
MSNSIPTPIKDRVASDFQTMKTEGGQRATRIKEILRPAIAETVTEVKAGSTTIWSIDRCGALPGHHRAGTIGKIERSTP